LREGYGLEKMMIARTIRIEGKVQGVFFRDWTVMTADRLGVSGWVRNRQNGSVEVFAQGEPTLVADFIEQLREGSPPSRVDRLDIEDAAVEVMEGFRRRPTA
jgi:acylphosphatase